jgi:rhodanese-related sulfurtransferase
MKPFPFLLCLMSLLGCKAADFRSVDAETFAQVIEDTTVIRLDVRTANEYAQGHIPGALLIDVTQADFMQKAKQLLPKDKTIALYCRSGRRSKTAAQQLAQHGYQVIELSTGFNSWKGKVEQ